MCSTLNLLENLYLYELQILFTARIVFYLGCMRIPASMRIHSPLV